MRSIPVADDAQPLPVICGLTDQRASNFHRTRVEHRIPNNEASDWPSSPRKLHRIRQQGEHDERVEIPLTAHSQPLTLPWLLETTPSHQGKRRRDWRGNRWLHQIICSGQKRIRWYFRRRPWDALETSFREWHIEAWTCKQRNPEEGLTRWNFQRFQWSRTRADTWWLRYWGQVQTKSVTARGPCRNRSVPEVRRRRQGPGQVLPHELYPGQLRLLPLEETW